MSMDLECMGKKCLLNTAECEILLKKLSMELNI